MKPKWSSHAEVKEALEAQSREWNRDKGCVAKTKLSLKLAKQLGRKWSLYRYSCKFCGWYHLTHIKDWIDLKTKIRTENP